MVKAVEAGKTTTPETNEYYKENFPEPMEAGKTNEQSRKIYYDELLKAGTKLLSEYFANATELSGKGRGSLPTTHKFRQDFKPKDFAKGTSYNRMWQAIQLASQDEWLKQLVKDKTITDKELEGLKIIEQWKLINKPNDDKKLEKVRAILGLTEKDRVKKGKVTEIAEQWTARDIEKALIDGKYKFFDSVDMLRQVIVDSTPEEQQNVADALDVVIDDIEANLLNNLKYLRGSIRIRK